MRRITFKNYAGFKIAGTHAISKTGRYTHLKRASWLTAMVESGGMFGSVMNYDGTGMTAGIHQAIAVYPAELRHPDKDLANDQGPLWKLLRLIKNRTDGFNFWIKLQQLGWNIGRDNKVRRISDGELVSGFDIRNEFNGSFDGVVPLKGEGRDRSETWIRLFAEIFSSVTTFDIQEEYGMEHFVKQACRSTFRFSKNKDWQILTMNDVMYSGVTVDTVTFNDDPELDLALCMYWSNSVNAPGMALKVLCKTLPDIFRVKNTSTWARKLIANLGNCTWGRWDDDIPNGRYQRTRKYAMESEFWPKELFVGKNTIMPKDLPG